MSQHKLQPFGYSPTPLHGHYRVLAV